jgi:sec-independent protein translocase protein TatA
MFGLRMPELLIILAVLVLLFGSKKLPELGDSLGKGIRAFKKAAEHGFGSDDEDAASNASRTQGKLDASAAKPPPSPATPPASTETEKAQQKSTPSP